ncbi:MAG: MFS transporter, partial [Rubrobacter sp.]
MATRILTPGEQKPLRSTLGEGRTRASHTHRAAKVPILVLALVTFVTATGSFIVAGLLNGVSEGLSVSLGAAGYMVTAFAIASAVGSPVLVAITGRVGKRRLLVTALLVFALANVG